MIVEIEKGAGFCPGVINAIDIAEKELEENSKLYCLGDIVHNNSEISRLTNKGLRVIDREAFGNLTDAVVLIRAHGEPPQTFETANRNHIRLINATCSIVNRLQKKVKMASEEIKNLGGQVVIFGKRGHPEVTGLQGHACGETIIIEEPDEVSKIDFNKPLRLFSQTTMDPVKYEKIIEMCSLYAISRGTDFDYQPSTCGWMKNRTKGLIEFSKKHDLIIFIAGKKSSNGKYLFSVVKVANKNSYSVSGEEEIDRSWFENVKTTGISGATSTPMWLMEKIAGEIKLF